MLRSSSKDVKSALRHQFKVSRQFTSAEGPLQLAVALRSFHGYTNGFVKCDASNYDTAQRELSVGPVAPSSFAPIHDGYCQGPDRDNCGPSFYSTEDMRQKE